MVPSLMQPDHVKLMRLAIAEAERARGSTGDNPWVGCVIVGQEGNVLAGAHTQGPGDDHAEIAALRVAKREGLPVKGSTMYSTLEPCSFHARTPACSAAIAEHRIRRVVIGMRDPHPRVNGAGARILRDAGVEVVEGICEGEVRRQLGSWVFDYHPHEPRERFRSLLALQERPMVIARMADLYAIDMCRVEELNALF